MFYYNFLQVPGHTPVIFSEEGGRTLYRLLARDAGGETEGKYDLLLMGYLKLNFSYIVQAKYYQLITKAFHTNVPF